MKKIDLKKKKILVVEDEENNWFILRDIIQLCNGIAIWAESGMKALQIVNEEKDIVFVFMDLKLPFMTGYQATEEIKRVRPDLPVVIQTAFLEDHILKGTIPEQCDEYIFKPVDLNEAVTILKKYILDKP